jgi:hypothetical protein
MSVCAQMSRVTDESKLPLSWLQGGDQQLGTTSVEALWALRQGTQQIIGPEFQNQYFFLNRYCL